ncbi:hypothetical protein SAMN04487913_10967 [Arthrobacter sp. ok362]|nr:hypothetical protein SAMN04487913_10967 [Arthrobacter sp. ok362]
MSAYRNFLGAVACCGLGCEVEGVEEPAVVAFGPVVFAADASGVPGNWSQAGYAGQAGCAVVRGDVAAGSGEDFGRKERAEAGHAEQDLGVLVFSEPGFDLPIDLRDFCMKVQHAASQRGDYVAALP